jgi:hypothetical protein
MTLGRSVSQCQTQVLVNALIAQWIFPLSSYPTNSLLKKASEHGIANAIKNSSSPTANKKKDSMSQRNSK